MIYASDRTSEAIDVDEHELLAILGRAGRHHVVRVGGRPTLIQDVQRHPATGRVLHVDFHAVRLGERAHAEVPLRVHGEEKLGKLGLVVQHQRTEVRVTCRPTELPDCIAVDVGELHAGDRLTAGDLDLPAGVELLHEPEEVVLTVLAPRVEAAEPEPETPGEGT